MAWVKLFRKPGNGIAGTGGTAGTGLGKSYQPGSMLSLALTKGLLNEPGQNSCFLNSAVQVLWQLDIFRRSLRQLSAHFCLGDACIFCALKSIFSQFQQSRERALPSDTLRHALAETFKDEQRFQLGIMDDAAECFENILERIHLHLVSDSAAEPCTSRSCITHQRFAMTLYEQFVCRSCGASSDPLPFTELVHYVSTTALCQQVERVLEKMDRLRSDMFGELLQAANTIGDLRNCPSNCGQSIKIRRVLMNCPEIVTIGFVWDAEQSDLTEDVIRSLGSHLNLSGLFYRVTDENAKRRDLHLVGMICYSSRHYLAFAYHSKSSKWVFFDDATVKEIGTKWKDVATKCIRGHFQPLLLFYANPNGTAVSNEDAPRQTTMWSQYKSSLNGEGTADAPHSGSKKLDGIREPSGSLRTNQGSHKQSLQTANRLKVLPESPGRPRESSREPSQGGRERARREGERGHRRGDSLPHKDMAFPRSSSPSENSLRPHLDQRHRPGPNRPCRPDRPSVQPRGLPQESRSHQGSLGRRHDPLPPGYSESMDGPCERGRPKASSWRPVRDVLNVDRVLSELEQRRRQQQQQQGSPRCGRSQERVPAECKPKGLMTIYEEEARPEAEIRASQECQYRAVPPGSVARLKGGAGERLRADNWTIQRTESGYESSDRLSSGSTNPDSPGVESFAGRETRAALETRASTEVQQLRGQVHHSHSDSKSEAVRSPLCYSKHLLKVQGKNSDHLNKSSPSARRKQRHASCGLRKGDSSEREVLGPEPHGELQESSVRTQPCPSSPAAHSMGRLSSSECNSSDEMTNPPSEQEDSAYRSSTSETAQAESPRHGRLTRQEPVAAPPATSPPPPARLRHAQRPCEGRTPPFRPRLLRESSQAMPRTANGGPRRGEPHPTMSEVSSRSGSDQERGDADVDERPRGPERVPQGPAVALTTYFSVDHCMTDTYRLKYHHQRPLMLAVPEQRGGARGPDHRESGTHSSHTESMSAVEHARTRPDTGSSSNKSTAKWHPVTPKGLDEHGYL
ncbi:ubiquitin carboxyl-terminal hydrolase 53 isoform X2 [Brachyhypopomus gauderio]|uniref:ubiquitin carboxyl-terminal hydrolase 53 isoform X2 n=1 Tax=Brachyhypopomus gauderio TaxID=698409 RepID=UPI0040426494